MNVDEMEKRLRDEATELAAKEPLSKLMLEEQVLNRKNFADMLSVTLACQLAGEVIDRAELEKMFGALYVKYPELLVSACKDLNATVLRDKGFQGLQAYRVAHALWTENRSFPAKMLQNIVSRKFGMDIHPAARIGHGLLIDHATNIVIGETAVVGNNVSFLHGVTLGGTGNEVGDRHPKIGNGVMLGAHAQLLGNIHIGDCAKIGAGAVVLCDVPPHTTYAGVPAVEVGHPTDDMPSFNMQQDFTRDCD